MPRQSFDSGGEAADRLDRVAAAIGHRLSGQLRGFRLEATADGFVLRGRAGTYHARLLAQEAVLGATGLPNVRNEIEVA